MNKRLPRVTASEIIRVLEKNGFELTRSSGSHHIYRNDVGRRVTVPVHPGKTLHPKLVKSIINDAGLSLKDFRNR